MQSLRRRLSIRKKKDHIPECSKSHQWQEDEKKVRDGSCCFQVKYMGYIEVFDSRGMHTCEEAVKALKSQCKGKFQRAVLYVSGDALRVVDEISKSMIVDQTIEKVSFCAPDRSYEKGFAYICRDGATRRWMCHGFQAAKESGERLSHAVGCAFAICLEKKQKRDKETGVTVTFNPSRTSFERMGSFRQATLTERIVDPQSAILAEPVPKKHANNPYAVQRPHATPNLLERQGSFRGFEKLQETSSPFKRTLSLRLNELSSTLQRQNAVMESPAENGITYAGPIPEVTQEQEDSIAHLCQQLTQGLTELASDDQFSGVPRQLGTRGHMLVHQTSLPNHVMLTRQYTLPASQTLLPTRQPITNPWGSSVTSQPSHTTWGKEAPAAAVVNSSNNNSSYNPFTHSGIVNGSQHNFPHSSQDEGSHQQQFENTFDHSPCPFVDTEPIMGIHCQQTNQLQKLDTNQNGATASTSSAVDNSLNPWSVSVHTMPPTDPGMDPFDVAWAAKTLNKSNSNPFGGKSGKQFEVQL